VLLPQVSLTPLQAADHSGSARHGCVCYNQVGALSSRWHQRKCFSRKRCDLSEPRGGGASCWSRTLPLAG